MVFTGTLPKGVWIPGESVDILVKSRAHPCHNIYVTLSIVMYGTARNYPGITTFLVRYYKVRCYSGQNPTINSHKFDYFVSQ